MTTLFFYGTLQHIPLLEVVVGRAVPEVKVATLADHSVHDVSGRNFPVIQPRPGGSASGVYLSNLSDDELARLDYYEGGFGYTLQHRQIVGQDGPVPALVYFSPAGLWAPGAEWDLAEWAAHWGDITTVAAREFMEGFGRVSVRETSQRYSQMLLRAASNVRAFSQTTPTAIRNDNHRDQILVDAHRRPYSNFFAVEEYDLRFPRYNGGQSKSVTRAAMVAGDAVTVIPYDPMRDRVMLIEQFRFAPFVRGDVRPWALEPIAGRIDPGETPEEAAHREMREEAGMTARELLSVANYYPSPGAWTEYLYTYVALADLPNSAAGIGGVEDEAEDIKSHILRFEDALELISTGEAETGPLITTLLWLHGRRDALRVRA